jgi:hypothetical protein
VTRRHRRDFLLDSGGVSALASSSGLLVAYLELLEQRFDGALLIPVPVLTEVRSGQRRSDTLIERLIKAIGAEEDVYAPLTPQAAARAGVFARPGGEALAAHDLDDRRPDRRDGRGAQLHVCGDDHHCDRHDIKLLVDLTRRTNIAVDVLA